MLRPARRAVTVCQGGTMRIFTQEIIVAPQHIDIQNRVSNLCYVQ